MGQMDKDNEFMRIMLKESDYAFTITMQTGGANNTDFADYTSNNFIKGFRHVLQKPDLSRAQLASMLRAAERHRKGLGTDDKWEKTMATIITNGANNNHHDIVQ